MPEETLPGPRKALSAPRPPQPAPTAQHYAVQLREQAGAVFLYASMAGLFQQMDGDAFKLYRDQLLADSGNPSDPIEIMMIEQIALCM